MADKEYSVGLNVSVGTTLDEASVKETERKIQERLANSVEVNVKLSDAAERSARLRAERGLPARTAKGPAKDINFNEIFKSELFKRLEIPAELRGGVKLALPKFDVADAASGLGEQLDIVGGQLSDLKKKIKETQDEILGNDLDGDVARIDFGGNITNELEVLKDAVKASNTFMTDISKMSGVKTLNIDYLKPLNEFEAEASSLTNGLVQLESGNVDLALMELTQKFALIGDTLVPNAVLAQEAFLEAARISQMLGVPVGGADTRFSISQRQARSVPTGTDRSSLGDSKQAQRITAAWQNQIMGLAQNPETTAATVTWINSLVDSIAESIYQEAAQAMQDSADYFAGREFKGGEFDTSYITKSESADIRAGSNEMGYWLEDFVSKIRELTLKRGLEPGSEIEIAKRLRAQREQGVGGPLSFQESALFDALEGQFAVVESGFQDFNANLAQGANVIADQILNNPAIVTEKPLDGGAQKEIKQLTAELPAQIKEIQALGVAAIGASESVKSLRDQAKESSNAQLALGQAEYDLQSAKDYMDAYQRIADDETRGLEQRASAAEKVQAKSEELAALEQKLIELRAKQTAAEISAVEAEEVVSASAPMKELESDFTVWKKNFLEGLKKLGEFDTVAFDTEFNDKLKGPLVFITEAAVTIKDKMGNLVDIFEMIHVPPMEQWPTNRKVPFAPKNRQDAEAIAENAMIKGGIGSTDPNQNFREYYDKIQKLLFVLDTVSKQAAIIGNNAGQTDLNAVGKVVEYLNKVKSTFAPELPKLEDITPGIETSEPYRIAAASQEQAAKIFSTSGASLSNMMLQTLEHFSDLMSEEQKAMFQVGEKGLQVKVTDLNTDISKWLPAHYAKVDNRIAIVVKSVLDKLLPVDSSKVRTTRDYAAERLTGEAKSTVKSPRRDKPAGGRGSGGDGPSDGGSGSGGSDGDKPSGGKPAKELKETFLAKTQIAAIEADLAEHEKKLANAALIKLQRQAEYVKLKEKEKGIREQMAEDPKASRYILPKGMEGPTLPLKQMPGFDQLAEVIAKGRKLERLTFDQVQAATRAGDVAKKYQNTAAAGIDTQIELERATKKAFSSEIQAQMKEQAQAAKQVEAQTKSLINQWVTGRYALYDVGNAYAGVSRQLWAASRQIFNITQSYRSYETAFTSVERAIQPAVVAVQDLNGNLTEATDEAESLKQAFLSLSEQIPVSFEELSRIATLGAQMGVSASGIVDFTQVVAKFSSVTGVAADTVAQKFGRIAELANVDYSEFTNLGSSILFAGMNAVATEPEIMTLAESIAAVSSQAGLVPSEIVGMATALASTGIQAEQARGVFTRVFADIDRAVSGGGKELTAFANIAGMSSEEFRGAWGTEGASYDVLRAILGGLGATEDLTKAFDSLNIVETREINTLTRLANNLNVVDQAISDSNGSFESATFLGDTFEKTVDNLDSKIQTFNNNVKSLVEVLSKTMSGSLGYVIDIANELLQVFKGMSDNKLFSNLTVGSLAITAVGAAASLGVSAMAKLVAQIYAFRVAAINTANSPQAVSGITGMIKQLTGWGGGLIEMRDQLKSISPDVKGVITPTTFGIYDSFADGIGRLTEKWTFLGDGIKKTDRVKQNLLKTQGIYLASSNLEADTVTQLIAQRKFEIDAIKSKTEAINVLNDDITTATPQELAHIKSVNAAREKERASLISALGGQTLYIENVNGEVRALTALEYRRIQGLATSTKVSQKIRDENAERLKSIAILDTETTKTATRTSALKLGLGSALLGLASGVGTAVALLGTAAGIVGYIAESIERTKINLLQSGGGVASLRDAIRQDTIEYQNLTEAQKATTKEFSTFTVKAQENTAAIDPNAKAIGTAAGASKDWLEKNKAVVESISSQTIALGKNTKEWALNAMMQDENLQNALKLDPKLLTDLEKYGFSFQEILQNIFKDPNGDYTSGLQAELDKIDKELSDIAKGPNAQYSPYEGLISGEDSAMDLLNKRKERLKTMIATIKSLGTAFQTAIAQGDVWGMIRSMLGLQDAIEDTGASAEKTEEQVQGMGDALRTVVDYASDLAGILSRVVELKFGEQMSLDKISSGWQDLADSTKDAKDAIKSANDEIKELTADKTILEYQLSVAERYGDEARAAKIRAELSKVNEQIIDGEEKLADAKSQSSTTMLGDSEAAIRNRAALLGMVDAYQSHIEMMAKLGSSREELQATSEDLKQDFLEQAKALGFNDSQLNKYAKLFDQFADVAIDAPRDVDIEVALGIPAAEQAINEFLAKQRSMGVDVKINEPKVIDTRSYSEKTEAALQSMLNNIPLNADTMWGGYLKDLINEIKKEKTQADTRVALQGMWKAIGNDTSSMWGQYLADQLKAGSKQAIIQVANAGMASVGGSFSKKPATPSYLYDYYKRMYTDALKFSSGGMVSGPGSGTSDNIPAMLSNGEFVVKAAAVKTYGVDFFNALNQQRMGFAPASSGAQNPGGSNGPQLVYLSPDDRALLRAVADRPVTLYADNTKIAQSANAGNKVLGQRGTK